jgi:hypothetical protein
MVRFPASPIWCKVVNQLRFVHEELKEWREGHEDAKDIGSSSIDQFPGSSLRDSRSYRKTKEGVDGLGRTGRGGKVCCQRSEGSRAKDMNCRDDLHPILTEVSAAFHQLEDQLPC